MEKAQADLEQQSKQQAAKAGELTAEQTEQFEVERAMLDQQRRALAKQQATLLEEAARAEAAGKKFAEESAQREEVLVAQEKAQKEQGVQLAAARTDDWPRRRLRSATPSRCWSAKRRFWRRIGPGCRRSVPN